MSTQQGMIILIRTERGRVILMCKNLRKVILKNTEQGHKISTEQRRVKLMRT